MRRSNTTRDFVARSIQGALTLIKDAIFAEEIASRRGLLQALDPRIKLAGVALLLLTTMFVRSLVALGALYGVCLVLAIGSRICLRFFLARTWVFIPLFSLAIAIPALFSFVSPGENVLSVGRFHVTQTGLLAVGCLVGRVVVSVSLTVLLSLTTHHAALLKALRACGAPQLFVMILGMCYRYIYLFAELVENTYRAIRSRTGVRMHPRAGQRLVAWNIGQLWSRSHALNDQVYQAMVARGFRGEAVALICFRARPLDWWWLGSVAGACAGILLLR